MNERGDKRYFEAKFVLYSEVVGCVVADALRCKVSEREKMPAVAATAKETFPLLSGAL